VDFRQRNWALRGFFQETLAALSADRNSHLTSAYRDITTKSNIATYCRRVNPDLLLFVDFFAEQ
jgi:hypothetical protein